MARRIHVMDVRMGDTKLPESEAHHVRDVLRIRDGEAVELFDDAGNVGHGLISLRDAAVSVRVSSIDAARRNSLRVTIASAIPKGTRADWLIEKLSELGVDAFVPLATARSVVVPEGKNKIDRWKRLAVEAAKQSHRSGVMSIGAVTSFEAALERAILEGEAWCLNTSPNCRAILNQVLDAPPTRDLTLFVGPEGDWSAEEVGAFEAAKVPAISLGPIILRVETACIAAAAVMGAHLHRGK